MKTIYGFQQKSYSIKLADAPAVIAAYKSTPTLKRVMALDENGKPFGIETIKQVGTMSKTQIDPFIIDWDWDSLDTSIVNQFQDMEGVVTNLPSNMVIAEGVIPIFKIKFVEEMPVAQKLQTVPGVTPVIAQAIITKFPNIKL